jgi:polyisoprenyl-phosphate glycosyltransferase
MTEEQPSSLIVMMPVLDDWLSAAELIRRLDKAIADSDYIATILLVDDGSAQQCDPSDFQTDFAIIRNIELLRLRRNLGPQRAIAIGLAHIQKSMSCDVVLVMDADGEDTPAGAAQLLRAYSENQGQKMIFAQRARRSESLLFRFFYLLYRVIHKWLTGVSVRVGSFSILSSESLETLVSMSELWNNYAGAVFRSRIQYEMVPIPRGKRIAGKSRMNFWSLVTHGLSAISVFAEIVGARLLIASLCASVLTGLGILAVIAIRTFTDRAIPGWATYTTGVLAIIMIQFITIATTFTFFVLSNRTNLGFLPFRDYTLFIRDVVGIYAQSDFKYIGSDLDLFAAAHNWKSYWSSQVRPFVTGDVLEVGAGIGSNTKLLDPGGAERWVCLEPDPQQASRLKQHIEGETPRRTYESICGTLASIVGQQFDTIIYIDVLEHIEHDREELHLAASHLRAGGHIIVLSPAHQRLFTPFDAAVGHFRRYNRAMLRAISPPGLRLSRMRYLDVIGLSASTANLLFLQQSMPKKGQLDLWDGLMIPISRVLDRLLLYSAGKSIIAIWQKPA